MSRSQRDAPFAEAGGALLYQVLLWLLCRRQRVLAIGRSMEPTLYSGDHLFVEPVSGASLGVGDVVVVRHPISASGLIVKRVGKVRGQELWLSSDNPQGCDGFRLGWTSADAVVGVVRARVAADRDAPCVE